MSLLREIQVGATEDTVSLGSLLRKTKLLAARLGVKEIGQWAERELSGYNGTDELPPYRGPFETMVLGHGTDGLRECTDYPIPPMALSEQISNGFLFKLSFTQGVAELEALAARKKTLRDPWPSNAVATFSVLAEGGTAKIDPPILWFEIWKPIPYPVIVGVLDAVRTRLLDLTMQLEDEEPLAERGQRLPDPKHAANILYTVVYADNANVAVGNRDVTQTQTQELPAPFDTDGLMDYLRKLGLDDEVIDDLQNALDEDAEEEEDNGESDEPKRPGRRALAWLNNVTTAITTQIGTPVATALITQALLHYFRF